MKYFFRIVIISFSCLFLHEQGNSQSKHHIYVEGLGNGILYSLNYDVHGERLGMRIGGSLLGEAYLATSQAYTLIGKRKHFLELGLGAVLVKEESDPIKLRGNAAVMYRFESSSGFLLRAGIAPTFIKEESEYFTSDVFLLWPGISIGYRL